MTPALEAAYAEPHRRYHTRRHVERCLTLLEGVGDLTTRCRRLLTWAIWWHDAVYIPGAKDNEDMSALMALHDLQELGEPRDERTEVARLIWLTKGHHVHPHDRLGEILVSIDLAILGAAPAEYDAYVAQIRAEYADVDAAGWNRGRTAVLKHFLAVPAIYPEPEFKARLEKQARENLSRELAGLEA